MAIPQDLKYTKEHEWLRIDGDVAQVGITEFASEALGDIMFVQLPGVGDTVTAGEVCGEVESTKSVSDLYSPVDGEVTEVNEELADDPGLINAEPYGLGWMFRVRVAGGQPAATGLLSPAEYDSLTKTAG
jgi:glycine cleavage system H protein